LLRIWSNILHSFAGCALPPPGKVLQWGCDAPVANLETLDRFLDEVAAATTNGTEALREMLAETLSGELLEEFIDVSWNGWMPWNTFYSV
jgi:hypothetical protein